MLKGARGGYHALKEGRRASQQHLADAESSGCISILVGEVSLQHPNPFAQP